MRNSRLTPVNKENRRANSPIHRPSPVGTGIALLWVVALLVTYHFQCQDPGVTDRFSNSSLALFDHGQWWRPVTALFLHANLDHLFGNIGYSLVFFLLVCHSLGRRTGWLLILASGTIGNILTSWMRYPSDYSSLGASTATFGALGILVGLATFAAWKSRSGRRPGRLIVPGRRGNNPTGLAGRGEIPTDVLGHLLGFLTGRRLRVAGGAGAPFADPLSLT